MKESEILKRIYPSVVTFAGNWREMLTEVSDLKLTEISLFLTCANKTERREIYRILEKTKVKKIPHVHARHDMTEEELDYLVKKYKTKAFTLHYQYYVKFFRKSKHKRNFFIENNDGQSRLKDLKIIKEVGGVCIDLSHFKYFERYNQEYYEKTKESVKRHKVGCNHLSAILPGTGRSWHRAKNFSELTYVKDIPKKFFSSYINLELGNPIKQQLVFKKKLAKLLIKSWNK